HRELLLVVAVEPGLPWRMGMFGGLGLHPAGEPLVEPKIVPPSHGDEVAEPLVRYLVREDDENAALRAGGMRGGIEQQTALEKCDAAPIFHRTAEPAGHSDQVKLGQ